MLICPQWSAASLAPDFVRGPLRALRLPLIEEKQQFEITSKEGWTTLQRGGHSVLPNSDEAGVGVY